MASPRPTPEPPPSRAPVAEAIDIDAYRPAQIAERVEQAGVAKARLTLVQTLTLAVLAGAFIAFGAMYYTVAMTEPGLGFGPARILGGVAFSLGLILVVIAGAELFTGNTLIVMAWIEGRIGSGELCRNWALVYAGNAIGAFGAAALVSLADGMAVGEGRLAATAAAIALAKAQLGILDGFFRGVLANALVCLAVWLSFAAREVAGKILAIVPPISAFVALGFEHSIANMYFLGLGLLEGYPGATPGALLRNLGPVTLGNIVGGGVFVGLVYWLCYRRR
jgi:formate transporter